MYWMQTKGLQGDMDRLVRVLARLFLNSRPLIASSVSVLVRGCFYLRIVLWIQREWFFLILHMLPRGLEGC